MRGNELLTIGELAARTGLSVSAIRFYEGRGLVAPIRTSGNQRRFLRSDIRRLSFALIAQKLGLTIEEIATELNRLPHGRTPTLVDWTRISRHFRAEIDRRIALLERTRDKLDGCIGCGCLSLKKCGLYNPGDEAAAKGPGPRYVLSEPVARETLPVRPEAR
ncbi:redox-sensitive transcriptional activator SoxR [Sphingomonas sp.]|jgi:MerR family redox-sensitive transcriptional activator SoxR|uniref:redox-sensitive transcriptional activator SoxR n=1 Tax=Sphingomonas sp. TaxID=28214 RepID=UPI002E13F684|nr:redox-sensitive transcriptional activator SoxR [Sphingomonas sp.]HEV7290645.1 redox-sensitive transcriptional activator SoxR [Sphingomonas sp.]